MSPVRAFVLAGAVLLISASTGRAAPVSGAILAPGSPLTEDFVLGPTNPGKWGSPVFGTGATVTWSLMASGLATEEGPSTALSAFMPAGFKGAIEAAFAAWSAVADITFLEVADSGHAFDAAGASGDIRIAGTNLGGPFGVLAHGYYPPANGTSAAGDIHFDTNDTWKLGFGGPGFDIFQVAAHEIGHAIGLDHTGVPNSLMNPFYTEAFAGLQADDIAGGQFIYGPAVTGPEVPEPASAFLFMAGLLAAPALRRRGRKCTTEMAA
jgi:hypothetical protein